MLGTGTIRVFLKKTQEMQQDYSNLLSGSSTILGYSGSTINGSTSNIGIGISTPTVTWPNTNFPTYDGSSLLAVSSFNIKNTKNMQAKLVVFKVERDEKGDVKSSTFLKEFWVEKLPNVSIELLAVKELEPGFEPNDIVVRELLTVYL
jgi:hypothetical protein